MKEKLKGKFPGANGGSVQRSVRLRCLNCQATFEEDDVLLTRNEKNEWKIEHCPKCRESKTPFGGPCVIEDDVPMESSLDQYGYPLNWPKCPACGRPSLDGHKSCGRVECGSL